MALENGLDLIGAIFSKAMHWDTQEAKRGAESDLDPLGMGCPL